MSKLLDLDDLLFMAKNASPRSHSVYTPPSFSTTTVVPNPSRKALKRKLEKGVDASIGKVKWRESELKRVQDKAKRLEKRIDALIERAQSILITLERSEENPTRHRITKRRKTGTTSASSRDVPTAGSEYLPTPPRTPGTVRASSEAFSRKTHAIPSTTSLFELFPLKNIKRK